MKVESLYLCNKQLKSIYNYFSNQTYRQYHLCGNRFRCTFPSSSSNDQPDSFILIHLCVRKGVGKRINNLWIRLQLFIKDKCGANILTTIVGAIELCGLFPGAIKFTSGDLYPFLTFGAPKLYIWSLKIIPELFDPFIASNLHVN